MEREEVVVQINKVYELLNTTDPTDKKYADLQKILHEWTSMLIELDRQAQDENLKERAADLEELKARTDAVLKEKKAKQENKALVLDVVKTVGVAALRCAPPLALGWLAFNSEETKVLSKTIWGLATSSIMRN